jgi:DNA-directed RNA polymerase subunit RPC12/RpoP
MDHDERYSVSKSYFTEGLFNVWDNIPGDRATCQLMVCEAPEFEARMIHAALVAEQEFTNHYRCDECDQEWERHDRKPDICDECPECRADIMPYDVQRRVT